MELFNFPSLKNRRRALRQQPILSEIRMWDILRNRRLSGHKFRRQYSIGWYIVDFYCPKLHLVIEVDGESHEYPGRSEYDRRRQLWLEAKGIFIIRFYGSDVINDPEIVVDNIKKTIHNLTIIRFRNR